MTVALETTLRSPEQTESPRLVFFDVDHTLIAGSSLAGFFDEWKRSLTDTARLSAIEHLERRARTDEDHAALVTEAVGLLAGQQWDEVLAIGERWYADHGQAQLIRATCERLEQHQRQGDLIVLVSGSWLPSLAPLARALDVEHILCCQPEHTDGVLNGALPYAVIGHGKVRAINEFLETSPLTLEDSYAYGDDPSDVQMLELATHAVAVGNNPLLAQIATTRGWERITTEHITPIF